MAAYEENVTMEIKNQVTLDMLYTEATYKRVVEDALFFLDKSKKPSLQ